jgi:hopanoid biosynthesis associated RND transporter like protein HpnN
VVLAFALATAASFYYSAGNLGIRGDTNSLFDPDLPFKQAERRYHEAFPTLYETMFVVVDAATPERAGEAASALAASLSQQPGFFHRAYLPGGGEFFEQHAFLYLDTDELEELADRLAEAQPYLAELSRDGTLRGLASMLARGARALREGDVSGTRLDTIFDRLAESLEAESRGHSLPISWAEVLAAGSFHGDARRRFLVVQPVLDFHDLQPAKRAILRVRESALALGLDAGTGVRVRITGDVALSYEEMEAVKGQAALAGLASFVLVGLILTIGLRSSRLVLSTLLALLVGLILTGGFTALAVGHFNLISVSFAVLFIGLGVDFGIHLCMRYRDLLEHGQEHEEALIDTARDVGSSLFLCAATTAIGFFAFVPTKFIGVAELGIISGAGMFISLFCMLTLLPALLSLPPLPSASGRRRASASAGLLTSLPVRYPRVIRAAALVLGVGAILLLPQARFDNNPLNVRDPSSESVRTFSDLLEKGSTSPWTLDAVAPDLETATALSERLRELDMVERVVTVADYIPGDQQQKLDIIEDVAMFLGEPPGPDGAVPPATSAEQIAALRDLERALTTLIAERPGDPIVDSAASLRAELGAFLARLAASDDPAARLARLEAGGIGSLKEQLRILEAALSAGHVTLENLPDALLERMVAADGRVRIQVFPAEDLSDHAALAHFVDSVRVILPDAAGSAAEVLESGRAVVASLRQAMLSAVLVITLLLLLLWRRLDDTALVMVPLGLAAVMTVAASVLLDIPFNFADVIVLPLLLGIGVDSGIHLVHRARMSDEGATNLLATTTARAVAFSAATTIASFGTMGFASHLGLATLGQLLTIGVSLTVVCNLVVLPTLITLRAPRRRLVESRSEV